MNTLTRFRMEAHRAAQLTARRRGFSLVEVVVAIALFGITMSAFGALSLAVARQSVSGWESAQRTAALNARVNDLSVVLFTEIDGRAGCTTITALPFPRTECVTVATVSTTRKRVRITITPAKATIDPAFVVLERTKPPATNPFNAIL